MRRSAFGTTDFAPRYNGAMRCVTLVMATLTTATTIFASAQTKDAKGNSSTVVLIRVPGSSKTVEDERVEKLRDRLAAWSPQAMSDYLSTPVVDDNGELSAYQKRFEDAERQYSQVDFTGAVESLETLVEDLDSQIGVVAGGAPLLEKVRIRLASILLVMADADDDEARLTARQRAVEVLADALQDNPSLVLDEGRYPPKMVAIYNKADAVRRRLQHFDITLTSHQSAKVVVEGQGRGQTPLLISGAFAPGSYRIWLERDGKRSTVRRIVVDDAAKKLHFDIDLEQRIDAAAGVLRSSTSTGAAEALQGDEAERLATLFDVDRVVIAEGEPAGELSLAVYHRRTQLMRSRAWTRVDFADRFDEIIAWLDTSPREVSEATSEPLPAVVWISAVAVVGVVAVGLVGASAGAGTWWWSTTTPAAEEPTVSVSVRSGGAK